MPPRKRLAEPPPRENVTLEDAVIDLTSEVRTLSQHVEVLIAAVDDARQEIETALRHLPREPWVPTQPLTSMPRDPLAEPFPVNRTRREDVPPAPRDVALPPVEPPAPPPNTDAGLGELF